MAKQSITITDMLMQGVFHHQRGELEQANTIYQQIITLQPNNFDALQLAGTLAGQKKSYDLAIKLLSKAIKINQNHPVTYFNLGLAHQELKKFDAAIAHYNKAIALKPDYVEAYSNLGDVLYGLKQLEAAIASYDSALSINPNFADALNNRGNTLRDLKRFDAAIADFDKAISINPDHFAAYSNRGNVFRNLKQFDVAIQNYNQAIKINPNYKDAYYNMGTSYQSLNQLDAALANYYKAISIDRYFAEPYLAISGIKIMLGEYEEGWELYEWRWNLREENFLRVFKQPLWLGNESIKDKTIFIHAEQGLGDTLQFCRYIAMLKALSPKLIILEVPKALISLLSNSNNNVSKVQVNIVEYRDSIPDFDLHCPMMSLPHAFKTSLSTIPLAIPYLISEVNKSRLWQVKLGIKTKTRIGLAWSGSTAHKNDHNRSLSLIQLAPIMELPYEFHSLQKEVKPSDSETLIALTQVHQHQDYLNDFTETAALIEHLDLVISVDTSVAHLAGAMGKKVFVLLPFAPDYRWMLERNDSPWYPTATLFRQPEIDDWESVINKVKLALLDFKDFHSKL